jgi:hypothetical protein
LRNEQHAELETALGRLSIANATVGLKFAVGLTNPAHRALTGLTRANVGRDRVPRRCGACAPKWRLRRSMMATSMTRPICSRARSIAC